MKKATSAKSASGKLPITVSHPDKVFWPDEGYTKMDLVEYYQGIFPKLQPYVKDRLLSLERCPDGMQGECFYQKQIPLGMPAETPRSESCTVRAALGRGRPPTTSWVDR
jgi:DNA primase